MFQQDRELGYLPYAWYTCINGKGFLAIMQCFLAKVRSGEVRCMALHENMALKYMSVTCKSPYILKIAHFVACIIKLSLVHSSLS